MTTPAVYGSATADPGVGPQPNNGIVVSGIPDVQWLKIENASNMYPSRLVKRGTNDGEVLVCGAGEKAIGLLGYEQAPKKDRPATRATLYTISIQAPVLKGKAVLLGYLAQSQTVVKGDKLVAAAAGMLALASAAKFATSTAAAVLGGTASPTIAGNLPTEGPIVATAEESVTTTDAEGFIMITLEL